MLLHLMPELTEIGKRGKGVVIGFPEELHATGLRQLAETFDHLRGVPVELLQRGAGDRERHLELPLVFPDQVKQEIVHRNIASLGHPAKDGPVGEIIIVVGILADVEESVLSQSGRLMDLEIQANALFHNRSLLIVYH